MGRCVLRELVLAPPDAASFNRPKSRRNRSASQRVRRPSSSSMSASSEYVIGSSVNPSCIINRFGRRRAVHCPSSDSSSEFGSNLPTAVGHPRLVVLPSELIIEPPSSSCSSSRFPVVVENPRIVLYPPSDAVPHLRDLIVPVRLSFVVVPSASKPCLRIRQPGSVSSASAARIPACSVRPGWQIGGPRPVQGRALTSVRWLFRPRSLPHVVRRDAESPLRNTANGPSRKRLRQRAAASSPC